MTRFQENLRQGKAGESIISKWLQSRGNLVFPAYEIEQSTGKGPQLFCADGDLVLPDLLAFRGRAIHWVEAKHKTCFTWHRITRRWVTGIDLRHYHEYQEVARRTGLPVWLMFWHPQGEPSPEDMSHGCPDVCPDGLFGGDIQELVKKENHRSDKWGRSGMVYWSSDVLIKVASTEDVIKKSACLNF